MLAIAVVAIARGEDIAVAAHTSEICLLASSQWSTEGKGFIRAPQFLLRAPPLIFFRQWLKRVPPKNLQKFLQDLSNHSSYY